MWFVHAASLTKKWTKLGLVRRAAKEKYAAANTLYPLVDSYLEANTTFYGRASQNQRFYADLICDYIIYNDPFLSLLELQKSDKDFFKGYSESKPDYATAIPLMPQKFSGECFEIHFAVYAETSKDEIHRLVDKLWKTVCVYQERLAYSPAAQRVKDSEKLLLKWRIYNLYLNGKLKYKEISRECASKFGMHVTPGHARKIVSEVKRDIEEMRKVN
jgi:hypothetical protein